VSDVKGIRSRSPEPPFCWESKDALRKIREHLDGDSLLPYALSVYCALTENASDKEAEAFTTLQGHLARLAGNISTRTVQRILPFLREISVIDYQTPKLRGPITFRLLAVRTHSPNVATNSPNVTTNQKTASSRTIEEHKKRESVFSSLKEAVAFFEAEFPDVPVYNSLSDLVRKKGKECLTKSYCRGWLTKEQRRKRPRPADPPAEPREQADPPEDDESYNWEEASKASMAALNAWKASHNGETV
jgi:hypothetical protein